MLSSECLLTVTENECYACSIPGAYCATILEGSNNEDSTIFFAKCIGQIRELAVKCSKRMSSIRDTNKEQNKASQGSKRIFMIIISASFVYSDNRSQRRRTRRTVVHCLFSPLIFKKPRQSGSILTTIDLRTGVKPSPVLPCT